MELYYKTISDQYVIREDRIGDFLQGLTDGVHHLGSNLIAFKDKDHPALRLEGMGTELRVQTMNREFCNYETFARVKFDTRQRTEPYRMEIAAYDSHFVDPTILFAQLKKMYAKR